MINNVAVGAFHEYVLCSFVLVVVADSAYTFRARCDVHVRCITSLRLREIDFAFIVIIVNDEIILQNAHTNATQ